MDLKYYIIQHFILEKAMKIIPIVDRKPDVEVEFRFNGKKINPVASGYRPDHLIKEGYLTCGVHKYFKEDIVMPDETVSGTITFISPEAYPRCLWVGKEINIQEGARIVGCAVVKQIFNPLLNSHIEKK